LRPSRCGTAGSVVESDRVYVPAACPPPGLSCGTGPAARRYCNRRGAVTMSQDSDQGGTVENEYHVFRIINGPKGR
jgi:hypothetical protein